MQTKKDYSYGVVLFTEQAEPQVLLVEQIGMRGDVFWTLPKGHPEASEQPQETALRELEEETGIIGAVLHPECTYEMHYEFIHNGVRIQKTVVFFLGTTTTTMAVAGTPGEIASVRWCPVSVAQTLATHEQVRDIIVRAQTDVATYVGAV